MDNNATSLTYDSIDDLIKQFNYAQSCVDEQNNISSLTYDPYKCPSCNQSSLQNIGGNIMCTKCYSEFGACVDYSAEWNNYDGGDGKGSETIRCGSNINPLLIESSYAAIIGYSRKPCYNRLMQISGWSSMPSAERSLKLVFDRLTANGNRHGLTQNIIELSHKLFVEINDKQKNNAPCISRGDPREGLISACLAYACYEFKVPRSSYEIAKMCEVDEETVNRGLNLFYDLMKDSTTINVKTFVLSYKDFIPRFCNKVKFNDKLTKMVYQIADKVNELKILNKHIPQAVTCACILFVANANRVNINKIELSKHCNVCVPTICKAYDKLLPFTSQLL